MKRIVILFILICCKPAFAQDISYAKKTLNKLTSPDLWGRGYTNNGMGKAADFIEKEFIKMGMNPIQQTFSFPVNTFPGSMELKVNGKRLAPGSDFIVDQASKGIKQAGRLIKLDSGQFVSESQQLRLVIQSKLTWSVASKVDDITTVLVKKESIAVEPNSFEAKIDNEFINEFNATNVYATIKGTKYPDSIIAITAHYDHLGGMGKNTYFPGANDNASGVALLLSLAKFYVKNPPQYTIAFICFGAEEAGLIGSRYFTENPLVSLSKIRFLFNLDLVGTGDAGATVVNATIHPKEFSILKTINERGNYLIKINARGKAANSDHYFFTEKGVPSFFLYTQGGISAYHDINDKAETLPFTVYENLFKLLMDFNAVLMN
ncbi:MAG: M28 family metallopeptidase [Bacteroidia bacterium]